MNPNTCAPSRSAHPGRPSLAASTALALSVVLALVATGCDGSASPVGPSPDGTPEAAAALATQAVAANWDLLPGVEVLHLQAASSLSAGPAPTAAALERLVEAGILAAEAMDMARGSASDAVLEAALFVMDEPWLELTGAVLGVSGVRQVTRGLGQVLAEMDRMLSGSVLPASIEAARTTAGQHLGAAEQALAAGRTAAALQQAAAGSDALRGLLPEDRVTAFVASAQALLARAQELAGASPPPEIQALLAKANGQCTAASALLQAGNLAQAVAKASTCAQLARTVIARLSGGVPDDVLQERATAAVEQATTLLERAVLAAGDTPPAAVQEALDEARTWLGQATDALAAGAYREAIRAAHASQAISRRILAQAHGGGGGDGSLLEDRVRGVLSEAKNLQSQAVLLMGPTPEPAMGALLATADAALNAAQAAFNQGDFRRALALAQEAMAIYRRVIHLLA